MLETLTRRLRHDESGVAMVVAIGALGVLLVLSTVTFSASSTFNQTSNVDRSARGAFQAAEAGLDVATYRVNNLVPLGDDLGCVASIETTTASGACRASGTLADGTTWSYEVTPELDEDNFDDLLPGGSCAGFPIQFDAGQDLTLRSRCITATGTVHGETRRVQARLALFTGTSQQTGSTALFPVGGIIGLDGIKIKNSGKFYSSVASNGQIELQNASFITGTATLGPGAPAPILHNNSKIGPTSTPAVAYRSPADGPWVLAPVDIGNTATENVNGTGTGWTLTNGGQVTYNATYREAEFNNGKAVLKGGDYNFCKLTMNNSTEFSVATGAKVRIFIDSPTRAGSGCRNGTGTFTVKNSFKLLGDESNGQIQIYVYGGDVNGNPAVDINNSSEFHALIHAPLASVVFKNSMKFYGAINAKRVEFQNASDFYFPANGINGVTVSTSTPQQTLTLFQRSAWRECQSAPTVPGNVHSGC